MSDSRYSARGMPKNPEKEDERKFAYILESMLTLAKMQKLQYFNVKTVQSEAGAF